MNDKNTIKFGLGLRPDHYEEILASQPLIDWFEILSENYLVPGGKPHFYLRKIREKYPVAMHGVSMSLGSCDPLDFEYLKDLKNLASWVEPLWISDHLCWTGLEGQNMHDLLPLPYTEKAAEHVIERIIRVQDYLGQQILIENVSSYLNYNQSEMTEWEFIKLIAEKADCFILLDINNIYVSAINHDFNPNHYLEAMPTKRVKQFHLAGHSDKGDYIIDTHDQPVCNLVWMLYKKALCLFGSVPLIIERDDNIPPLEVLIKEVESARQYANLALAEYSYE